MTTRKTGSNISTVKNQTPSIGKGTNLVENVSSIIVHQKKQAYYTRQFEWLTEREKSLQIVIDAYDTYKKQQSKPKNDDFFKDNESKPFPFKLVIIDANESYIREAVVEIQKPNILGGFTTTLLEFVLQEKNRIAVEMQKLELEYAKTLTKK